MTAVDGYDDEARVLVAVVPKPADLERARREQWYRVPLAHTPYPLDADLLALYLTGAFGPERWAVRYIAPITGYEVATRRVLLPSEAAHPRADERYYRLALGTLAPLLRPVPSRRLRRVVFIATTLGCLLSAGDVVDLFRSPQPAPDVWGAGIGGTRRR